MSVSEIIKPQLLPGKSFVKGCWEASQAGRSIDVNNPATGELLTTVPDADAGLPIGGCKQSGFGRDLGSYALDRYTNVKSVWIAL